MTTVINNLEDLEFPPGWPRRAQEAYEAIKNLPPDQRNKEIDKRSKIWSDLKDYLAKLSENKCWYCESREIRSNKAVDHYRPKNEIFECPSHSGYWWLAFNYLNFRYSCQLCNEIRVDKTTKSSYGKGTHFPLLDESKRVYSEGTTFQEDPALLDPTEPSDCGLLSFDDSGEAAPTYKAEHHPRDFSRAMISIRYYNLNQPDIKEKRQKEVCRKIQRLVEQADIHLKAIEDNADARIAYKSIFKELHFMISRKAEYSAVAKAVLLQKYQNRDWIKRLLLVAS